MKRRLVFIIICIMIIAVVVAVTYLVINKAKSTQQGTVTANQQTGVSQTNNRGDSENQHSSEPQTPTKRSDTEILEAIIMQDPTLVDANNQSVVTIVGSQKTANNWYVVTLKHRDPTVTNAKIILKDSGNNGGLVIVAGPGTYFDPETVYLPDEVRVLL